MDEEEATYNYTPAWAVKFKLSIFMVLPAVDIGKFKYFPHLSLSIDTLKTRNPVYLIYYSSPRTACSNAEVDKTRAPII